MGGRRAGVSLPRGNAAITICGGCRDDSACVQLEEILRAGREVLHDYQVSQAMSMWMSV